MLDIIVDGGVFDLSFVGTSGNDTYQDRLAFGAGIAAADVAGERVGEDLVLAMTVYGL